MKTKFFLIFFLLITLHKFGEFFLFPWYRKPESLSYLCMGRGHPRGSPVGRGPSGALSTLKATRRVI